MKHTPGPWDWHGPYMTGAHKVSALHPEGGISLNVIVDRSEDNAANARLIAAAPDLLEALATMLGIAEADILDDKSNVWRSAMIDARDAIKRAEGEA